MQLEGRVALVTGAGEGIGRATAKLLAKEGARIGALGRTREDLDSVVKEIENDGGQATVLLADISKPDEVEAAVKQLVDAYGRLDVVFANAGVNGVWAPIEEIEPDEWTQTIGINLSGTFFTIKYAAPHLKKQGGAVVITSSVNGTRIFSNTGATAYSSTKAAQVAMGKMLALELAPSKVRVNVICPGAIETEIDENTEKRDIEKVKMPVEFPETHMPLTKKPGTAEQVARLVLFLVSDASDHITGSEMWIDGGESLLKG
jgi:NAD(P)-dependent dehydrogenase (short-subunit alcohol dehydrogenase family)